MHEALIREKYKEPVDRKFEDAFAAILDGLQLLVSEDEESSDDSELEPEHPQLNVSLR